MISGKNIGYDTLVLTNPKVIEADREVRQYAFPPDTRGKGIRILPLVDILVQFVPTKEPETLDGNNSVLLLADQPQIISSQGKSVYFRALEDDEPGKVYFCVVG